MDMKLKPFDFAQAVARAGLAGLGATPSTPTVEGRTGGFSQVFTQALRNVSGAQNQAQALQREVTLDNPKVSLEETMVAMQRSNIGFQAALQVRNRMVQAYSDVMNMQV
ncbi:MAG: flagellar hook-basal body complex protein FliE [Sphaerotilus sp.]|jgi:flagellar hook-basal body complex protein FliE|nr:flagellar hook-basal body complex protein FliE [Sphaerotilus sp.]